MATNIITHEFAIDLYFMEDDSNEYGGTGYTLPIFKNDAGKFYVKWKYGSIAAYSHIIGYKEYVDNIVERHAELLSFS